MTTEIRELIADDITDARRLQSLAPTRHLTYILERFPRYFEAVAIIDPAPQYFSRQCLAFGAFANHTLVGTIGLLRVPAKSDPPNLSHNILDHFYREFTDHDAVVFDNLNASLEATHIGAPDLSYLIHSLHVLPDFRGQGVATLLMNTLLSACTFDQKSNLFIETARERPLRQFVESFSFNCIKKTFSFSERLEYGTWGAFLFQYTAEGVV